jgi:hypothetical protein
MDALCGPGQIRSREQGRIRVTILVLVVIILTITAIEGWTMVDVIALITAIGAASSTAGV